MTISTIYGNQGNYEKAFEVAQQALVLSEELHDVANKVLSLTEIGKSYRNIGDYASALEYYKKANDDNPGKSYWCYRHLMQSMGDLYCDLQKFDSARDFYQQSFKGNPGSKSTRVTVSRILPASSPIRFRQNIVHQSIRHFKAGRGKASFSLFYIRLKQNLSRQKRLCQSKTICTRRVEICKRKECPAQYPQRL